MTLHRGVKGGIILDTKYQFNYRSLQDIRDRVNTLGVTLPLSDSVDILKTPFSIGDTLVPNRMGIAPMEGADSLPNGEPSDLTTRRYIRFARGGAGVIWFEAVSVVQEGRSSLKQLLITKNTLPAFQRLNDRIKEEGLKANGYEPYLVMQANHSGRYSRPNSEARPEPIVAFINPVLEKDKPLDASCVATDDYLARLEETFGEAAELAKKAGFDAIDVKSCHGYLLAELAGAHTRKGKYGGSFENRFRLLFNAIRNAQQAQTKNFKVVARINLYDNIPYPYGFGMAKDGGLTPDYEEPLKLIKILHAEMGMPFINVTMGDPHYDAYITRPFNQDTKFKAMEDPLVSVARIFNGAALIKRANPGLLVSASAPSYLRNFAPNLAAGAIEQGFCDHVCFGRLSFANPDFPNDIIHNGELKLQRSCITCSKCSELLRAGFYTGCVVRDSEVYLPLYKDLKLKN